MGLESDLTLAAGALVVLVILFYYVLRRLSKAFGRIFSRLDRKANDVAIYLSHINEDKNHIEMVANNKVDAEFIEAHFSSLLPSSKVQKSSKMKAKIKVIVRNK